MLETQKDRDTFGFLIHDFWAGRKSSIFGFWAAPGARETMQKCGGLRPPHFGMAFGAPGAAQTPKIDDFRPAQKSCMKNPCVMTASPVVTQLSADPTSVFGSEHSPLQRINQRSMDVAATHVAAT